MVEIYSKFNLRILVNKRLIFKTVKNVIETLSNDLKTLTLLKQSCLERRLPEENTGLKLKSDILT